MALISFWLKTASNNKQWDFFRALLNGELIFSQIFNINF